MLKQVLDLFGDVLPFLDENTGFSPATRAKLLDMLNDPQQKPYLMVELAVTIDAESSDWVPLQYWADNCTERFELDNNGM